MAERKKNMTRLEINAALGWNIRHHKGFYYKGKRYSGIAFHEDCVSIHAGSINSIVYIDYEDIIRIENVKVNDALQKTIIAK